MPRYVAFLRGVSPLNARMPDLRRAFEDAGFSDVKTILASGNVAFDAALRSEARIEQKAEAAMSRSLARSFHTIVRSAAALQALIASDPWAGHAVPEGAKRVVTFMRDARAPLRPLPLASGHACVLRVAGREAFTVYGRGDQDPVFMRLIEMAFGKDVTTRTWETLARCAAA